MPVGLTTSANSMYTCYVTTYVKGEQVLQGLLNNY